MLIASDLETANDLFYRYRKAKEYLEKFASNPEWDDGAIFVCGETVLLSREETMRFLREVMSTVQSELYALGVKV